MGAKGRKQYPWAWMIAELRARPGRPRLFPAMVGAPLSVVERVRRRRAKVLRLPDGTLHAYPTSKTTREDGSVVADIWLAFKPHPPRKDTA